MADGIMKDVSMLETMANRRFVSQKVRDLAEIAARTTETDSMITDYKTKLKTILLIAMTDYEMFNIYISIIICAANQTENPDLQKIANKILNNVEFAKSLFNFGLGCGPAIIKNLKKLSNNIKKLWHEMSGGTYSNGIHSRLGWRLRIVSPWITKDHRNALNNYAIPALKALLPPSAFSNFKAGVAAMGSSYVSPPAAEAVSDLLEKFDNEDAPKSLYNTKYYYVTGNDSDCDALNILECIGKVEYPKLMRYLDLVPDGEKITTKYLKETYFPLMKALTELFERVLKIYRGNVFVGCKCNDPNKLDYGLGRLTYLLNGTNFLLAISSEDEQIKLDENQQLLCNIIINYLCKSNVLAQISKECGTNYAKMLQDKYGKYVNNTLPDSKSDQKSRNIFSELGNKVKTFFSKSNNHGNNPADTGNNVQENTPFTLDDLTEIKNHMPEGTPNALKESALCESFIEETKTKSSTGDTLKDKFEKMYKNELERLKEPTTWDTAMAGHETTDESIKSLFYSNSEHTSWYRIIDVFILARAACMAKVPMYYERLINSIHRCNFPHWLKNDIDSIKYKYLDKVTDQACRLKDASENGGTEATSSGASTAGSITQATPFTKDELAKLRAQVPNIQLAALNGSKLLNDCEKFEEDDGLEFFFERRNAALDATVGTNKLICSNCLEVGCDNEGNEESQFTWGSEISIIILLLAGHKAKITSFYERLVYALKNMKPAFMGGEGFLNDMIDDLNKYLKSDHYSLIEQSSASDDEHDDDSDTNDDDDEGGLDDDYNSDDDSAEDGAVTKETPFTVDDLKKVADKVADLTIDTDLPGLEQSQFFAEWAKKDYKNDRAKTKKRATDILSELTTDLNPTALDPDTNVNEFITDLFATSKDDDTSYYIYSNELRVMILAIAGNHANIRYFYGRLINTLIGLKLEDWGKSELEGLERDYFDKTTFKLKPASAASS